MELRFPQCSTFLWCQLDFVYNFALPILCIPCHSKLQDQNLSSTGQSSPFWLAFLAHQHAHTLTHSLLLTVTRLSAQWRQSSEEDGGVGEGGRWGRFRAASLSFPLEPFWVFPLFSSNNDNQGSVVHALMCCQALCSMYLLLSKPRVANVNVTCFRTRLGVTASDGTVFRCCMFVIKLPKPMC